MCCRALFTPQEFTQTKGASACFPKNKSSGESARDTSFLIKYLLALGKLEPLWWNPGLCFWKGDISFVSRKETFLPQVLGERAELYLAGEEIFHIRECLLQIQLILGYFSSCLSTHKCSGDREKVPCLVPPQTQPRTPQLSPSPSLATLRYSTSSPSC